MKSDDPLAEFAELEKMLEQCSKKEHRADQCPRLRAEIRKQCTRDLHHNEGGMSRSSRLALSALFVAGGVALLGGGMRYLHSATHAVTLGLGSWSVMLGIVLMLGLGSLPGRRAPRGLRLALVIGVPILVLAALAAVATHISSFEEFADVGLVGALPCCGHALLCGALVSGAILLLWRRTDPFSPGLTGALVGLVGGLAGAVSVGLSCPSGEGWHLWLGHGITVAAVALLGFIIGRRLLAP